MCDLLEKTSVVVEYGNTLESLVKRNVLDKGIAQRLISLELRTKVMTDAERAFLVALRTVVGR